MAEAEDRTEAATPRKLQNARASGEVALSRELAPAAVLGAATIAAAMSGESALHDTVPRLAHLLADAGRLSTAGAMAGAGRALLGIAAPMAFISLVAGAAAVLLQTGFLINAQGAMPDLARLDPRRGLKRIFSVHAMVESGKSMLKIAVVGFILYRALRGMVADLPLALFWGPTQMLDGVGRHTLRIVLTVLGAQAGIGLFDVMRARFSHGRSMRMSRQEVKDEHKDTEGDPRVKGRRRLLQRQRARTRMMAAVPTATVVVTNPTHYAVALAYDRDAGGAPRVVAKGMDEMAARIREVARANRIPLVANPPLARALHEIELDREIPAEMFKAVAEIIAYVWRLNGQRAR